MAELERVLSFSPYNQFEEDISGQHTCYFLSIMKNKLDSRVDRGSIVKALAFGSKNKMVECLKAVIKHTLEAIFEVTDPVVNQGKSQEDVLINIKKVISEVFNSVNSQAMLNVVPHTDFM